MKNFTIAKKIMSGFALAILITAALGIFASVRLANINYYADKITKDNLPGVYEISRANRMIQELLFLVNQCVSSMDKAEISSCSNEISGICAKIDETFS